MALLLYSAGSGANAPMEENICSFVKDPNRDSGRGRMSSAELAELAELETNPENGNYARFIELLDKFNRTNGRSGGQH